ncbi:hypothetical protein BGZ81_004882 [Podila clonocystis]|nr:hypothetical protein BGZ81_004882 [Podila clonocystis]
MTARVDIASVQVNNRLDFDVVFSTCPSNDVRLTTSKVEQVQILKSQFIMPLLLKDIATMNMAITFGFNDSARNVALWAHQSVLSHQSNLSSFMNKLQDVEGDPSSPEAVCGVKTTHVSEYSLEAYCALVRYLYTSEIALEVDVNNFAIGFPPNKPFSPSCKKRPEVDVLKTLRMYCFGKIVTSITDRNALEAYFEFAYKYEAMKAIVLEYVFDSMDKLFATDEDPFEAYKDHPEKHSLTINVMQRKFKG